MKYCIKCGAQLDDSAKFCTKCGAKVAAPAPEPKRRKVIELPKKDVENFNAAVSKVKNTAEKVKKASDPKPSKKAAAQAAAAAKVKSAPVPQAKPQAGGTADRFMAAATAGEIDFGEFDISGKAFSDLPDELTEALSPVKAIFSTLGSFIKGLFSVILKPKNLIIAIIMVAIWVALGILKGNTSQPVKILSWLTFANGGLDRDSLAGMIGGIFGKGTVAAALGSLFTGGIPNFFKGIGSAIKGTGEKRSIVSLIIGAVLGAALYLAFTGPALASKATAMAGIAGAVLSLESIGRKAGPLYSLAQGLTSKKENGLRFARSGKAQSLLSGLFLGFAIVTAVTAFIG